MDLKRLTKQEVEAEAARRGWSVVSNQHGIQRIEIDGAVIESSSMYSPLEVSIPAPPAKVTRHRLTLATPWGTEAAVGDFETSYEASDRARDLGVDEKFYRIEEVEVEEVA